MSAPWLTTLGPNLTETSRETLSAFPNTSSTPSPTLLRKASLSSLESIFASCEEILKPLPKQIFEACKKALDGDEKQATMFSNRFKKVAEILHSGNSELHKIYFVALVCRACEIIDEPDSFSLNNLSRKALRVRAVSDFYYSHSAVLYHLSIPERSTSTLPQLIAEICWSSPAIGIQHGLLSGLTNLPCGPIRANVMVVDPNFRSFKCLDVRSEENQRLLVQTDAFAVSGGFFLFSEAPILEPSKRTDPVGGE